MAAACRAWAAGAGVYATAGLAEEGEREWLTACSSPQLPSLAVSQVLRESVLCGSVAALRATAAPQWC